MHDLSDVLGAVNDVGSALSLISIGIFLLLWKYGGEMLHLARVNSTKIAEQHQDIKEAKVVAEEARAEVQDISAKMVTNHGSKNIGDAIDRLTEWMLMHLKESRKSDEMMAQVRQELVLHLAEAGIQADEIRKTMAEFDERIAKLETEE